MIQPHTHSDAGTHDRAHHVADLLDRWQQGCADAGQHALVMIHTELRALARGYLRHERPDHTLQPTALVHEAFIRMAGGRAPDVRSRRELIAIAARVMRQVLVSHARQRQTLRRGRDAQRVELDQAALRFEDRCISLIDLDDALDRLHAMDPRQTAVVELRFFAGMTSEQTARVLGTSLRTVERDWTMARAWLRTEIAP